MVFLRAVCMLGFQYAADVLLLEQQYLRHSRFARMHMLFLDAFGAAEVCGGAASAALRGAQPGPPQPYIPAGFRSILLQTAIQFTYDDYYLYQGTALARI